MELERPEAQESVSVSFLVSLVHWIGGCYLLLRLLDRTSLQMSFDCGADIPKTIRLGCELLLERRMKLVSCFLSAIIFLSWQTSADLQENATSDERARAKGRAIYHDLCSFHHMCGHKDHKNHQTRQVKKLEV